MKLHGSPEVYRHIWGDEEDEEPYLDKNRTKETGNFQLVFNTVVEINQNIYSITQESWMTKKLDQRKQTKDQNNTTSDC